MNKIEENIKICVIGLGYVGLPLAVVFSKKYQVFGFDISKERVDELKRGYDRTLEIEEDRLKESDLLFTTVRNEVKDCNYFIVTVPTPIDKNKQPDLTPLIMASQMVGALLKPNDIVIYESTVYPGCTEEDCVPVLENASGLKFNVDFFCGYSPERINPGDKHHTLEKIRKVVSGSTPDVATKVEKLYSSIITAGTYKASSIRVAEAAKVIENSQRDLNIAFVNELSKIFNKMNIDTQEVLDAAGTKWNFLPFKPGLVGGHCIGVDPFYLTYKAQELGYNPEIILAGRRLNDGMGEYIASLVLKLMIKKGHRIEGSKILILGITFKENCPDIRNTKVVDIIKELRDFGVVVNVSDPWARPDEVKLEYNETLVDKAEFSDYDAVILAVGHSEFAEFDLSQLMKKNAVLFDVKSFLDKNIVDARL
jgi:UDP-N-acetyl-D-galactosamine dehydrogenase